MVITILMVICGLVWIGGFVYAIQERHFYMKGKTKEQKRKEHYGIW